MVQYKPLGNRVLVRRLETVTSKGGILLPDSAQEKPRQGTVLAVGPGKRNEDGSLEATTLKINDEVLYGPYAGTEVGAEEDGLIIISEDDILGVVAHSNS